MICRDLTTVAARSFVSFALTAISMGPSSGDALKGDWLTPGGSVVRVVDCESMLCLTLVKLASDVKVSTDVRNPDIGLRGRPLCGLRIGDGFITEQGSIATGGKLYDPESGKTYSGKIALDGDRLKLRGYVGITLFGRSETWKRVRTVDVCH